MYLVRHMRGTASELGLNFLSADYHEFSFVRAVTSYHSADASDFRAIKCESVTLPSPKRCFFFLRNKYKQSLPLVSV